MRMNSLNRALELRPFAGRGDLGQLLPPVMDDHRPHEDALARGRLTLQRCSGCKRSRYPFAPVCPQCFSEDYVWSEVSGNGHVHSWVRYQKSYLPEFEPLMPYV